MRNTEINWTDHTFNPWWGCTKVSAGCDHCYAEAWDKRYGGDHWGRGAPRRVFGDAHWQEPVKWNRVLEGTGTRERVFCASMADVFEVNATVEKERARLWDLIRVTPNLDWLLLTKRHANIAKYLPWGRGAPWPNVWVGVTIENQQYADIRLPYFTQVNAVVRFISAEPLLGPIDFGSALRSIHWMIVGGESGRQARIMQPAWVESIRLQCQKAGVPFHFKQWGEFKPLRSDFVQIMEADRFKRLGKKKAGNLFQGKTWLESPRCIGGSGSTVESREQPQ